MTDTFLNRIILRFSPTDDPFPSLLQHWLMQLGTERPKAPRPLPLAGNDRPSRNSGIEFLSSEVDFYPKIRLDFFADEIECVGADFTLTNSEILTVKLENVTGENRKSPHIYSVLKIEEALQRLESQEIRLAGIDHVGCNLPWFAGGLHPQIDSLRKKLAEACLYHLFPTGEAWDFIIPGDIDEIERVKQVDYSQTRRPKFEIVSFEKSSTPLVQFDVQLNVSYEALLKLFPEALNDPELRNLWIYLENPYNIDVCIVANEADEGDWSEFFKDSRLSNQETNPD